MWARKSVVKAEDWTKFYLREYSIYNCFRRRKNVKVHDTVNIVDLVSSFTDHSINNSFYETTSLRKIRL